MMINKRLINIGKLIRNDTVIGMEKLQHLYSIHHIILDNELF